MNAFLRLVFAFAAITQALPNDLVARQATPPYTCGKAAKYPATCGERGSLTSPAPVNIAGTYDTLNDCINACKAFGPSNCASFGFDTSNNKCTFYSKLPAKMGYVKNKKSTASYYANTCFACKSCTATLTNGGFESGGQNPWYTQDLTASSIVTPGEGGSTYAFSGTVPEGSNGFAGTGYLTQALNWCNGTTYTVSFDYQTTDSTSAALFVVVTPLQNGGGSSTGFSTFSFTPGQWESASFSYTPSSASALLQFQLFDESESAPVTFLIDNVAIAQS